MTGLFLSESRIKDHMDLHALLVYLLCTANFMGAVVVGLMGLVLVAMSLSGSKGPPPSSFRLIVTSFLLLFCILASCGLAPLLISDRIAALLVSGAPLVICWCTIAYISFRTKFSKD